MNLTQRVLFCFPILSLALACSGGGMTTGDAGPDSAPPCATGGMGTLNVTVTGLPASAGTPVSVTGGGSTHMVGATGPLMLPSGSYDVTAAKVVTPDPIVRTVYNATVSQSSVCVGSTAQTVTVTYTQVPSSNKIWFSTSNAPTGNNLQGFASSALGTAGSPDATVGVKWAGGRILAFDKDGNLWSNGGTVGDPTIVRVGAGSLGMSGSPMPDRKINIKPIDCLPTVNGLALDKTGALWVSSQCKNAIYKLDASQLAADGDVTPSMSLQLPQGPEGLAFDKAGNLWVGTGQDAHLVRFDAASLTSATAMPTLTLAPKTKATGGFDLHPAWLAFDASGNLWTNDFGGNIIFQFPAATLTGTASMDVIPPALVTIQVGALLGGMSFDEGGGLWITYSQGKFARLTPAQLLISTDAGMPTMPDRLFMSANLGYGENMVLYPAPAALPLASALP
jgi:streptogramin lyase